MVSRKSSTTSAAKKRASKKPEIAIEIRHSCEYRRQDWWDWAVWIEAADEVLDQIEYVDYRLHPTFPNQLRHETNRKKKFGIESAGWGEFMIGVEIVTRSGEHFKRQHWLSLEYPTATSKTVTSYGGSSLTAGKGERPTVFLTGGVTELTLASALGESLQKIGFEVVKMEDAPAGVPWETSMSVMMKQADVMVTLISGNLTSWGMREIAAAMDRDLPIVPVVIGSASKLPEQLQSFQAIPLKEVTNATAVAPGLAQQIKQTIKL